MADARSNHAPEIIILECGCTYNAYHKKGDRSFRCRHGSWIIRHRTKTVHYYDTEYIPAKLIFVQE